MSVFKEIDILHRTYSFLVRDAGAKGFEIYKTGEAQAMLMDVIADGLGPDLGIQGAIARADKLEARLQERVAVISRVHGALKPLGWIVAHDEGGFPTLAAKKTFATAVGPRDAEAWVGDRLRKGNLVVFARYGDALDSVWLPVHLFEENVQAFSGMVDTLVVETYAAGLSQSISPISVLTRAERSAAWGVIFGAQATVMDVQKDRANLPSHRG